MPPEFEIQSDPSTQRVTRAIEALRADYDRQGYLTDDQVVRAVHKRKIEADGHLRVRQALADAGIAIEGAPSEFGYESANKVVDTSGDDTVRRYLVEIGKYRLLKAEDEITLGRRVQIGRQAFEALTRGPYLAEDERAELHRLHQSGREAEQQMVSANLRLVVSIAKRYSKTLSLDILDLIQEGTLGLMRAVELFDYQRGYKLSTYATWWILQAIMRGIADKDRMIRLPVHVIEGLGKLRRLRRRLSTSMMGGEPEPRELALHLGWTVEKVRLLLSVMDDAVSLDAPIRDSEESLLGELLRAKVPDPEQLFAGAEEAAEIGAIVDRLGGVTAEVIRLRFGMGTPEELTLQEIGDRKGVTRERIRQIEAKGLGQLQRKSRALSRLVNGGRSVESGEDAPSTPDHGPPAAPAERNAANPPSGGVLATVFYRLPGYARDVLGLRYGLDGRDGLSEEDASARLEIKLERLRRTEFGALDTLGHSGESFRRLLRENAVIRESLCWRPGNIRRKSQSNRKQEAKALTHDR